MSAQSASVLEDLRSRLSGDTVDDISRRIGADPAQTKQAIDAALPMLLAALGKEAADLAPEHARCADDQIHREPRSVKE